MLLRVTIADVAREAGVSRQTASRALSRGCEMNEVTRQRVLAAAERLGYVDRRPGRSRTQTLGLVVADIANPFFAEIVRGAGDAAHAAGYGLLLCNTTEDAQREAEVLRGLEARRVDGVVLCGRRLPDADLATLIARHPAAVLVNSRLPDSGVRSVCINDAAGAAMAVQHLLRAGRRRLAFLSGPMASQSARERSRGFAEALAAAGLRADPVLNVPCAPYLEGGRSAARELLTFRRGVDAIFCYNDLIAVGALQACTALGRRVPEDVAVVGDDDIPLAGLVTPALTTLRCDKHELGAAAVRLLLAQLAGEPASDIVMEPELVVRASAPLAE